MNRRTLTAVALLAMLVIICAAPLTIQAAPQQQTPPGTSGLVACWELDETSGTRNDSWSINHLTDNNTVTSATGVIGNAAQFVSGNSESLSIADNAALSGSDRDFTIVLWAKISADVSQVLLSKYKDSGGVNAEYIVQYHGGLDRFQFLVSGNGTSITTVSANTLGAPALNTWYYIQAEHNASANTISIKINSLAADSTAHSTGIFNTAQAFRLGSTNNPDLYLGGELDLVSVWDRVFTSGESTYLYNSGSGRSCADLLPATATPTSTNTDTPTATSTSTATATSTATPTATYTPSMTPTPTNTPTITPTPTITNTPELAIWGEVGDGTNYKIELVFSLGNLAIFFAILLVGIPIAIDFGHKYLITKRFTRDVGSNVSD
jgi:hypothetical protein